MVGLDKGTLAMLYVTHLMAYQCIIIKGDSLRCPYPTWVFPMKALETKESDHSFPVPKSVSLVATMCSIPRPFSLMHQSSVEEAFGWKPVSELQVTV